MAYKKNSAWKRANWGKWTFWRKVRHILAAIFSLIVLCAMWIGFAYVVFIYFGVLGFLLKLRDTILLGITHSIFG